MSDYTLARIKQEIKEELKNQDLKNLDYEQNFFNQYALNCLKKEFKLKSGIFYPCQQLRENLDKLKKEDPEKLKNIIKDIVAGYKTLTHEQKISEYRHPEILSLCG